MRSYPENSCQICHLSRNNDGILSIRLRGHLTISVLGSNPRKREKKWARAHYPSDKWCKWGGDECTKNKCQIRDAPRPPHCLYFHFLYRPSHKKLTSCSKLLTFLIVSFIHLYSHVPIKAAFFFMLKSWNMHSLVIKLLHLNMKIVFINLLKG